MKNLDEINRKIAELSAGGGRKEEKDDSARGGIDLENLSEWIGPGLQAGQMAFDLVRMVRSGNFKLRSRFKEILISALIIFVIDMIMIFLKEYAEVKEERESEEESVHQ